MTPSSAVIKSPHRTRLHAALAIATVLGLALMVASLWVPPLGWLALAVALLGGFVGAWSALREFAEWREDVAERSAKDRSLQRQRTQQLHTTQRDVLTAVDARIRNLDEELTSSRAELGEEQAENSRLRGDNAALRTENETLRTENDTLRTENDTLRSENDDLRAASDAVGGADEGEADVLTLPRRRADAESVEWDALEVPTVINLDLQRLASPFVEELQRRHAN